MRQLLLWNIIFVSSVGMHLHSRESKCECLASYGVVSSKIENAVEYSSIRNNKCL